MGTDMATKIGNVCNADRIEVAVQFEWCLPDKGAAQTAGRLPEPSRGDRGCHQGLLQHFHVLAFKWSIRMSAIIHLPATLYQYRPRAL